MRALFPYTVGHGEIIGVLTFANKKGVLLLVGPPNLVVCV